MNRPAGFLIFLAFYDKAGDNFVGRSGTNNFETTEDRRRKTEDGRQKRQGFHIEVLTWMDSVSIVNHRFHRLTRIY